MWWMFDLYDSLLQENPKEKKTQTHLSLHQIAGAGCDINDQQTPQASGQPISVSRLEARQRFHGWLWRLLGMLFIALAAATSFGFFFVLRKPPALLRSAFIIFLGSIRAKCFNHGRKLVFLSAEELLSKDFRPPVLYLRSFSSDSEASKRPRNGWVAAGLPGILTEEEQLVRVMQDIGPVIAIGRPGDTLPALGAVRIYVGDEEWQANVAQLIEMARLVVVRAGDTNSLWWEVQRAMSKVQPEQLGGIFKKCGNRR
jgi:hypothetical protein